MKNKKFKWLLISMIILLVAGASYGIYYHFTKHNVEHHQHDASTKKELWTCPMHPQVISDKPGQCPICEMDLVKKQSDDAKQDVDMKNMIKLSDNKLILADVSTYKVQKEDLIKKITAYSYMDFAEPNSKVISARFNGRIEKLFVGKTGDNIVKGQPLFEIYSPDFFCVKTHERKIVPSGRTLLSVA